MRRPSRWVALSGCVLALCGGCDDDATQVAVDDASTRGVADAAVDATARDAELPTFPSDASVAEVDAGPQAPRVDAGGLQPDAAGFGADPASMDPGRPDLMFGTKADARLYVEGAQVGYAFFRTLTPNEPTRAHLFAELAPLGNENIGDYYLSLVVDDAPWSVASYEGALGGRVRITLSDGRSYAADAAQASVKLTTSEATVGPAGQDFFLRGSMELTVPSTQPGAAPLLVKSKINDL